MALKRIFSHNSHSGQRSRNGESEGTEEYQRSFSDDHHEHHDVVQPIRSNNTLGFPAEQQPYRARRRSSVQILDRKFIQSLSNTASSTGTNDPDSLFAANISEDVCELFYFVSFSFCAIFLLLDSSNNSENEEKKSRE